MIYLIPNTLCDEATTVSLPQSTLSILGNLRYFIVEDVRTVRRFLSRLHLSLPIDSLTFYELNEHTTSQQLVDFITPLKQYDLGVISEAGAPGVADPGCDVVRMAHEMGIQVVPLIGPSSILLALMASGMNGQNFAFNGYLPVKQPERIAKIKALEKRAFTEHQTQIFIETPYRNMSLWQDLITNCRPTTRICVAADITDSQEFIQTKTVQQWMATPPQIHKRPAVFLLESSI